MFKRTENFKEYTTLYPVASILIALNIIIYLTRFIPTYGDIIFALGAQYNLAIAEGQYWRVLTSMFLHADFMHVLMNMFWLFLFGPELELLMGKLRFLTIFLSAGLIGNIATFIIYDAHYLSVGASGAIFGIMGAYAALIYYTRKMMPELRQLILPLILVSVVMTFIQPNINAAAHLGGLAGGFLLGLIYLYPKRVNKWRARL
ncbi:Rhomboid protease gluP [Lysinibacillus sp. BF-4]|uniref:rhomboid family intramembrane serine protease n=1 Tax=Lysinibacillus sp. BF-4 TaxID=1473546 RepID=UPI0005023D9F|nr:rhomboid family intramembrane serine protease [Lysinibacillus sp. BF-4]KFL42748.1 Rhomboid protease gluP [Lysinibacillus sp. BF-4]